MFGLITALSLVSISPTTRFDVIEKPSIVTDIPAEHQVNRVEDPNRWTALNTGLELSLVGLSLLDIMSTRAFLAHSPKWVGTDVDGNPSFIHAEEEDPILGKHPDAFRLYATGALVLTLHLLVAHVLPRGWRETWQSLFIGFEVYNIIGGVDSDRAAGWNFSVKF